MNKRLLFLLTLVSSSCIIPGYASIVIAQGGGLGGNLSTYVANSRIDVIQLLLSQYDKFNSLLSRDSENNTPFLIAAKYGQSKVCEYLLKDEGVPSFQKANGSCFYHIAAENNQLEILINCFKLFSQEEVKNMLKMPNGNGETVAQIAARKGNKDILLFLEREYRHSENEVKESAPHLSKEYESKPQDLENMKEILKYLTEYIEIHNWKDTEEELVDVRGKKLPLLVSAHYKLMSNPGENTNQVYTIVMQKRHNESVKIKIFDGSKPKFPEAYAALLKKLAEVSPEEGIKIIKLELDKEKQIEDSKPSTPSV